MTFYSSWKGNFTREKRLYLQVSKLFVSRTWMWLISTGSFSQTDLSVWIILYSWFWSTVCSIWVWKLFMNYNSFEIVFNFSIISRYHQTWGQLILDLFINSFIFGSNNGVQLINANQDIHSFSVYQLCKWKNSFRYKWFHKQHMMKRSTCARLLSIPIHV